MQLQTNKQMQRYFSFGRALVAFVLVALALSCTKPDVNSGKKPVEVKVIKVVLDMQTLSLEAGNRVVLTASAMPSDIDAAFEWSVSDSNVISLEDRDDVAIVEALEKGVAEVTVRSANALAGYEDKCVAVCRIEVLEEMGGVIPQPDPQPQPDPDPQPDPQPQPQPNKGYHNYFELPAIADANADGKDDNDSDIYYAQHHFSMGGKDYRNYTVCYSAKHHCPLWVAAPRHSCFSVKNVSRSDAYKADPSVPSDIQYKSKDTGGGCNKGHMLGSAERLCSSEANRQVFYYTNIAPQLSTGFNTGGGGWNLLEDFIDTKVPADTLYEVIGCYFEKYKDGYGYDVSPSTISFGGRSDVSMPTMFYYAVLRTKSGSSGKALNKCSASELQCVAFVRSHTNSLKGQKPSSKELMSISDLEKITGVSYFTNVPNAPKGSFTASDWGL